MPISADAYAAISGLAETDRALAAASELPASPRLPAKDGDAEFADAIQRGKDLLLAGKPLPADIAHRVVLANAGQEEPRLQEIIRQRVISDLQWDRDEALRSGTDSALAVLATELERILTEVRRVDERLGAASTEEEAIEAGGTATEAWAQLQQLVDDYDELRHTQLDITSRGLRLHGSNVQLASVGLWRDSIDRVKFWIQGRYSIRNAHRPRTDAAVAYVAWLNSRTNTGAAIDTTVTRPWWPNSQPAAHLLWLAQHGQPWIPSLRQAEAAFAAATAAIVTIAGPVPPSAEDARRRYYQVTGAVDTVTLPAEHRAEPVNPFAPQKATTGRVVRVR